MISGKKLANKFPVGIYHPVENVRIFSVLLSKLICFSCKDLPANKLPMALNFRTVQHYPNFSINIFCFYNFVTFTLLLFMQEAYTCGKTSIRFNCLECGHFFKYVNIHLLFLSICVNKSSFLMWANLHLQKNFDWFLVDGLENNFTISSFTSFTLFLLHFPFLLQQLFHLYH